jgi:arylsulfatase A-like enzyme
VDTLRADHLHAYGYGRESTPNLDALFAEGILFENAHSNASCTFPSVNSLLTSRHPMVFVARGDRPTGPAGETGREEIRKHWQSGSRPARFGIPEDIRTLPAILRSQGYSTLAVSASPIVRDTVSDKKEATNRWGGFGQGFDVFHEACLQQDAECVNRAALQLLEDNSAQPFFLYLHYMEPHGPYQPPAGYKRRFATTSRNLSAINNGNPYPYKDQWLADAEQQSDVDARDLQHLIDLYDDEIAYFDEKLAELLGELSARGLDEAILVLASDHGEAFAEHGVMAHCQTLFEPEVRVPLFMRWPGGPTGLRVRQAAQNLDVAPTILDLAGIDYDAERFDGRSLRRLVADENAAPAPRYVFAAQRAFRSVNDDRYKLVVDLLTREMKLFDLEADPAELFDLAESEQREFRRLRRELVDFLNETEGGVGTKNSLEKGRKVEEALEALGYLQ